eukprot:Gb_33929 [translate_table: standard]
MAIVIYVFVACLFTCLLRFLRYCAARLLRPSQGGDGEAWEMRNVGLSLDGLFVYNSFYFKQGLQCAVCLCEMEDNEDARLLPICNHSFHKQCIDMWFYSHSTCPLCRTVVRPGSRHVHTLSIHDVNSSTDAPVSSNGAEFHINLEEGHTISEGAEVVQEQNSRNVCIGDSDGKEIGETEEGASTFRAALPHIAVDFPSSPRHHIL